MWGVNPARIGTSARFRPGLVPTSPPRPKPTAPALWPGPSDDDMATMIVIVVPDIRRSMSAKGRRILEAVAASHKIPVEVIRGRSVTAAVRRARWEVIWESYAAGLSMPAVGRIVNKDHTAVLNALRRMAATKGPYR